MNNTDIEKLSKAELEERLVELEDSANRYFNYEQSVKRILNSIYGAFGNQWFYFFNLDIAESITLQGQDAILYSEKMLNLYFTDFWHKDTKTHEKLGITVNGKCVKPVVIYIDTDSCYVSFEEAIEKSTWDGEPKDFIQQLYDARLGDYIAKVMQKYADAQDAPPVSMTSISFHFIIPLLPFGLSYSDILSIASPTSFFISSTFAAAAS